MHAPDQAADEVGAVLSHAGSAGAAAFGELVLESTSFVLAILLGLLLVAVLAFALWRMN